MLTLYKKDRKHKILLSISLFISAVLLLVGIPKGLPYDFYILLRFVVCGTSVYTAYFIHSRGLEYNFLTMCGIALLFNPLIPFHLSKDMWVSINGMVSMYFIGILICVLFLFKFIKED